ncbi:hypothetical protein [Methanobrevibacter sp. V74]|uniref:hypothetical protein n=1 Tax=Methanobrevibacter sp. V74 TaxID=3064279 RepID=UPI00273560F9|nr:hypothetical protein [Methanobrevibacter sp. V74]
MNPPFFPNETMNIYTLKDNSDDYDYYGSKNEYVLKETIPVDIQPLSPTSSLREFGKILQDTYKVIFNIEVEIKDTDQLRINDTNYEIIGSISTWNHVLPHKEMLIKKQRKKAL